MNILFLCKRRPQNKDILSRPYGRFFYLPKLLAQRGHTVHILLLDYSGSETIEIYRDGIHWYSISLFPFVLIAYYKFASKIIEINSIDWVVGLSDTYFGIMAQKLATKFNIKSIIDAYDNYESYISWFYPLHYLWRNSLNNCDLVTVAGPQLADLYKENGIKTKSLIVPMSADPEFIPLNKNESRKKLNLPLNRKIVGYCGSLSKSRGIKILFELISEMSADENCIFVLSGKSDKNVTYPKNVIWLGYIDDELMPTLVNSLDIMLVLNLPSKFGNYSYPAKLYEAMNCRIPVVAGKTKSVEWILREFPEMLASAGNIKSYLSGININLKNNNVKNFNSSWETSCEILENELN